QRARRARNARQDEHTMLVIPRSDEFLGDEVHAVMQAGDHAQIGSPEQLEHFAWLAMPHLEQHGQVVPAAVPLVDLADEGFDLLLQMAIGGELAAGRRRDLQEYEAPLPFRVTRQQGIDRPQPVENSLGVIEPLDADAESHRIAQAQPRAHRGAAFRHRLLAGEGGRGPFDRNWIGAHESLMAARGDGSMLAIDPALNKTIDRVDEIVAIELRMKAEHGAAEQSLDDRALPGTDAEGFRVGPRNVPERDDGGLRQPLANHLRQQREMI